MTTDDAEVVLLLAFGSETLLVTLAVLLMVPAAMGALTVMVMVLGPHWQGFPQNR
jgi:hypothetical protein